MKNLTLDEACEFLKRRNNFLILTHTLPDGDTVGSAAALCLGLQRIGKTAWLYNNTGIIKKMRPYTDHLIAPEGYVYETVVSVDIADAKLFPSGFSGTPELAIDHHPMNTGFADMTLLDCKKASCGEIVLQIIKRLTGGITKEEADPLYIAVTTDTGCFRYANTTSETLHAAAELLDAGADSARITKAFFRTSSLARIKLEGLIFSGLKSFDDGKIVIAVITQDMMNRSGATEDDMDDIASLAGRAEGCEVAVTIREQSNGTSKVSLRTSEKVNACNVCANFGGGGHAMASGCKLKCCPDETISRLIPYIRQELYK